MNFFEEATLRLKQQLGMTQDQEVAKVLEMTPRAWAGRKKTESFPETEVLALSARRPDLGLDVSYILKGKHASKMEGRLLKAKKFLAEAMAGIQNEQAERASRMAQVQAMLEYCDDQDFHVLADGVMAMGNRIAQHKRRRQPGVTTWHQNDAEVAAQPAPAAKQSRKKAV
jgi:transcriptional regulator with XRE-family HTH domain